MFLQVSKSKKVKTALDGFFSLCLPFSCLYGDDGETLIWFPYLSFRSQLLISSDLIDFHSIVHRKVEEFDHPPSQMMMMVVVD